VPTPRTDASLLQEAIDLDEIYGSPKYAIKAGATTVPYTTLLDRVKTAKLRGFKPTVKKDAPRYYEKKRLGKMFIVIPDTQVKTGVCTDHLEWIGNYISEKRPDAVIHIGDHWDMPSLSSYDKGKLAFEGRRYVNDVKAGRNGMERLLKPFQSIQDYKPRMVFTMGNHEMRVSRFADNCPEMSGHVDLDDLGIKEYGWEVIPFLQPIEIDQIEFCHYFTSGLMGRPVSSAAVMLRERQKSCIMGHVQTFDMAVHKKTQNIAMMVGTCYLHDEDYLGPQGNNVRRQIVVLHEVEDGKFDPMLVSLKFLEKAYG
jgi:hypothetical protein